MSDNNQSKIKNGGEEFSAGKKEKEPLEENLVQEWDTRSRALES